MPATKTTTRPEAIRLRGVRQNNLQNLDVDIPLGQFTVVTGLSGTGKSSLAFETLHAEGQRRYVETFSPYTRQFLELMDRPDLDEAENIRPSIAIQQRNSVRTSRSTVGTMTELCDYFKVWFSHVAKLYSPDTGKRIEDDTPEHIWQQLCGQAELAEVLVTFQLQRSGKLAWADILAPLHSQGFTRVLRDGEMLRLRQDTLQALAQEWTAGEVTQIAVITDRVKLTPRQRARFTAATEQAFHYGEGKLVVYPLSKDKPAQPHLFSRGLHCPQSGRHFRPPTPNLFSFNSPLGACEHCRGFGRVIEIDYKLVIPDTKQSIAEGAIRPFQGQVYQESLRDLMRIARQRQIPLEVPWQELSEEHQQWVIQGDPDYQENAGDWNRRWYGVRRFFKWLEGSTYKMHVRVFLSKYRSYTTCPSCHGKRLKPESLCWKWQGQTLPDLYQLTICELRNLLPTPQAGPSTLNPTELALQHIRQRLSFLGDVGLDYLTLDRTSRTLSGGEIERINLTTCLGTSLTDTLFVLDEPSVGLHARDIHRLGKVLRRLTEAGNTVVVVEHDEDLMRAADHLIELGPEPGKRGGQIIYQGPLQKLLKRPGPAAKASLTGRYLRGELTLASDRPARPVPDRDHPWLSLQGVTMHNVHELDLELPLRRLVALCGVSGSGKSTLLNHALYQGLRHQRGLSAEEPASIGKVSGLEQLADIVLVDQSSVSRTPRSNPVLYIEAWDAIRKLYAMTEAARRNGLTAAHFSFNAGQGRCEHCQGLGYERIEMQFLADVYVRCPVCEGRRFKPDVLEIQYKGWSINRLLQAEVTEAIEHFDAHPAIRSKLSLLKEVGLGYLSLGQPLNTLSGGESQRLKLVKYLSQVNNTTDKGSLLLLDEPTTGLHRDDVGRLLAVLQRLTEAGHSVIVVEHQLDVLQAADWLIDVGPEAGAEGGQVIAQGPPATVAGSDTATGHYLGLSTKPVPKPPASKQKASDRALLIHGAREHNLRNLSLAVPHNALTVVTGVSGSGKSSLAFDIVFAEGQRRYLESMSAYARQFVEQLPRASVDAVENIPPTVAIEQRVTRGSRKSTVASVTEVAQYLRLLFARCGIQHSPLSGQPVTTATPAALAKRLESLLAEAPRQGHRLMLAAPLVSGRKGHHQPLADWALEHGIEWLRCDGHLVQTGKFTRLDRYREHDIEAIIELPRAASAASERRKLLAQALKLGKGTCLLVDGHGHEYGWLSTLRSDPATGQAFPELDPKHFSWNSPKGWCPACRGHGVLENWMQDDEQFDALPQRFADGEPCPVCGGSRLNPTSAAVRLPLKKSAQMRNAHGQPQATISLPELLALPPALVTKALEHLKLDARSRAVAAEIIPEVLQRLAFLGQLGLGYLCLDRASSTLSGGEAQRIRLAAQLGSRLSGVLYVLDEPSIGLHAKDNEALIQSLHQLRDTGNSLLVVEHDEQTMRAADHIIDLGPGAGTQGGQLLAQGRLSDIQKQEASLTARYLREGLTHPMRGQWRDVPAPWSPRQLKKPQWLVLREARLRNLKGFDLHLPLQRLTMICGVSGAGKSTLIRDLLQPLVKEAIRLNQPKLSAKDALLPEAFRDLYNGHVFRQVIEVDQQPIGKTPRSTPATYIGAFDLIREAFASLPEAKMHGYCAGHFSFNTKGGRCEVCKGAGRQKLEMQFLPDSYVTCEACAGTRYGPELAEVRWDGRNIAEVLQLSFTEAVEVFAYHTRLRDMMQLMVDCGLGYLRLGQSSPTLSGGEAQRLKLVSELVRGLPTWKERSRGEVRPNLYLLEEPSIGLHLRDIERLSELLHRLVELGHTVIVIEHELNLLAEADWLVEIGPGGGENGGQLLYQGVVTSVSQSGNSLTAPYLEPLLSQQATAQPR